MCACQLPSSSQPRSAHRRDGRAVDAHAVGRVARHAAQRDLRRVLGEQEVAEGLVHDVDDAEEDLSVTSHAHRRSEQRP